jgi:hypothetical protein
MAFKGGTSLSKVYGAIRRFSEDVDVAIDYKSLDQGIDPFDTKTSRTASEKFTDLLRTKLADHTKNVIRPQFENLVAQLAEKPPRPISLPHPVRPNSLTAFSLRIRGRTSSRIGIFSKSASHRSGVIKG